MSRGVLTVMTALVLALALAACDGGDEEAGAPPMHRAEDRPTVHDGLLVTRSTGDVYELHDGAVECMSAQEDDATEVVRLTMPKRVQDLPRSRGRVRESFFYVEAKPGVSGWYELPLAGAGYPELTVFGVDAPDQNELNASLEGATGSVTILEATCDPEPALAFTISATLASEISLPPVTLVGGYEAGGTS